MERASENNEGSMLHRVESEAGDQPPVSTYQIDPEQMAELSVKLTEEGRRFMKAYKQFKDSYFSMLDNDVSLLGLIEVQVYLVHYPWLKLWKKWIKMKLVKKNDAHINYVQDELERNYPGPITNEALHKDPTKYLRLDDTKDPTNFAIKTKAQEGKEYKLLPKVCWQILAERFPGALEIVRFKDTDSYLRKFNIKFQKVSL